MIEDVQITPLRQFPDERGKVMHMLRADSAPFQQFGEIYFSCVYPTVVKAWTLHKEMTINCAVIHGQVKYVLYDPRKDSSTFGELQELIMGPDNYFLITVPPLIWAGFTCIGDETAILANCATLPHTVSEYVRIDAKDPSIPYDWARSNA